METIGNLSIFVENLEKVIASGGATSNKFFTDSYNKKQDS